MSFLNELKRRNVFRVGIAYLLAAWVLLQVVDFVLDAISAPNWILQVFLLAAAIGFFAVLLFSWIYEVTPEGIKREKDIDRSQSITPHTGRKLDRVIITFLAVAVVLLLADRFITAEKGPDTFSANEVSEPAEPGSENVIPAESTVIPADSTVIPAESTVIPAESTVIPAKAGIHASPAEPSEELAAGETSIAVLPFVNMSSDPEQEYFSDGLAEELLNRLAQNGNLRVAARTSAFQFKGQNLDVAEIGRQLKVDHVLEGSVRKAGNRLRITAQLINVADGFHLWSETYEREIDDIFAIQDDISGAISQALELELGAAGSTATLAPTSNLEAYNLYLRGRFLLATRGGENMLQAEQLFERAVALDPEFSAAWSAMAFNSSVLFGYTYEQPGEVVFAKAVDAAQRAIELDPENAEAYIALSRAKAWYFHHWQESLAAAKRAYELAPNNAEVVNIYGDVLIMMGAFQAAERIERKAALLDPLSATNAFDVAMMLLILNRAEEALEPARTAMDLAPDSYYRVDALIYALLETGSHDEAKALIEATEARFKVSEQDPATSASWRTMYFYETNDRESLRAYLNQRLGAGQTATADPDANAAVNAFPATYMTFYMLWLDGAEAALPWLQKARASGEWMLLWPDYFYLPERMSTDPAWLEFWDQPEYQELFDIRRSQPYDNVSYWKAPEKRVGAH